MNDSGTIDIATTGAWRAFEVVNPEGRAGALITCDHASRAIPPELDDLGLPPVALSRHIAWDIGAADVARRLAALLDAPAVLAGTSRLVVDCNRMAGDTTAMPAVSDGTAVPGNRNLDEAERARRHRLYFQPYHAEVSRRLTAAGPQTLVVSVHSFTPAMNGITRPWHVGVLHDGNEVTANRLLAALRDMAGLVVGDNEPYSGGEPEGYGIKVYGKERGHPMAMFEIRQDLVADAAGTAAWADILHAALSPLLDGGGRA